MVYHHLHPVQGALYQNVQMLLSVHAYALSTCDGCHFVQVAQVAPSIPQGHAKGKGGKCLLKSRDPSQKLEGRRALNNNRKNKALCTLVSHVLRCSGTLVTTAINGVRFAFGTAYVEGAVERSFCWLSSLATTQPEDIPMHRQRTKSCEA